VPSPNSLRGGAQYFRQCVCNTISKRCHHRLGDALKTLVQSYERTCGSWTSSRSGWPETPVIEKLRKLRYFTIIDLQSLGEKDIQLN
jgi:hypothetical protein